MTVTTPSVLAGRYALGPLLGSGAMAQVHRGTDLVLGRPVAVKVFRLGVEGGELARIEQETQTLARLNHPGLVAVHDAGGFAGDGGEPTPYLVMELVEGPTWAQCCSDGSLSAEQVAARGAELAETLAYVHAQGVVHRDVKPANVLLADGERTKLADFGIALLADAARHTQTGLTIGTAPYLSPEQVTGSPVGPPSDVYSLGLLLLEALTGRREYAGTGTEAALARLHRAPAVPADAPAPLREALLAMTALAPEDRPTAAQAAGLLRGTAPAQTRVLTAATRVAPVPAPAGEPSAVREALREAVGGRRLWLGVLAVLGALVLLAALLVSGGGDDAPAADPAPATPAEQLDRDLADLRDAVTP